MELNKIMKVDNSPTVMLYKIQVLVHMLRVLYVHEEIFNGIAMSQVVYMGN